SVPADVAALRAAVGWLTSTFAEVIAAKRRTPGDDLISGWVRARDEADALSEEELVSLAFLMVLAGLENSVLLPANLIVSLLTDARGQWPRQRKTLVERASPVPFAIRRFATAELSVGGATIAPGETVLLSILAADSDPARGDRPSLMFGRGPHYCLGARIADLIVDAVVTELLARHPNARLAVEPAELRYRVSWRSHGLSSLPVLLDPA
ncbi:cytochrome P450, partial [Nocardia gipuzkoensis]